MFYLQLFSFPIVHIKKNYSYSYTVDAAIETFASSYDNDDNPLLFKVSSPQPKSKNESSSQGKKKPKNKINKYSIYYIAAAIVFLECILCLYITEM